MATGIDPSAVEMSEFKGELLGLVVDLFDDLENRLAQCRNNFLNSWNEAAFHDRGDDGAPPAIPLAATGLPAAGVDARHPASGGNGSVTTQRIEFNTVSSKWPATCTFKPLDNSECPVASVASHTTSPIQQKYTDKYEGESDDNSAYPFNMVRKQTTKELLDDMLVRTKLVGQFQNAECSKQLSNESNVVRTAKKWTLKDFVTSAKFDLASASVIILNAMVMGFEVQSKSFDYGYALGYPGHTMRSEVAWPGADTAFYVLEFVFGLTFTFELLIKLYALRWEFHKAPWNLIDVIVVVCWFVTLLLDGSMLFNPTLFRLLRILKLIRLAKMFKTIEVFDSLQVLVGSIRACFSALIWSCFLLLLIQTMFAFIFNTLLGSFIVDENQSDADRLEIFELFGSFSRAMMSMTELTIGNWVPICRALYGKVAQAYGYVVLVYVILVNFAVVRVITGVFLQTTFSVAAEDDDLMVVQKLRAAASHRVKMMRLLTETDVDGKGYIVKDDFRYALQNSKLKQWLAAMDLEVNDADLVFDFLDNGDGALDYDELIQGVSRLKGTARSIDVVLINRRTLQLGCLCKKIIKRLDRLTEERRGGLSKFASSRSSSTAKAN